MPMNLGLGLALGTQGKTCSVFVHTNLCPFPLTLWNAALKLKKKNLQLFGDNYPLAVGNHVIKGEVMGKSSVENVRNL